MTVYATYFDSGYLLRGIACIDSLIARSGGGISVLVLSLDDECATAIASYARSEAANVRFDIMTLDEMEKKYPALKEAKVNRLPHEYYFTLTPFLCDEALALAGEGEYAVYLDADLFFYADPAFALDAIAGAPIAVTEHRYPKRLLYLSELYGRFNVGWLAFRRSLETEACLSRWQAQCLQWCHDRASEGRFGDQKFLDEWPSLLPSLRVNEHPGVNLAPWNVTRHCLTFGSDGHVEVDGADLVFFHFHHLHRLEASTYEADYRRFGVLDEFLCSAIYAPYLRALDKIESRVEKECAWRPTERSKRYRTGAHGWCKRTFHWPTRALRLFLGRRVIFKHGEPLPAIQGLRYE